MARAVQHLVEELREVVHLHYYEGQKIDEIARMTKASPATVAKRLSRAREAFRTVLGRAIMNSSKDLLERRLEKEYAEALDAMRFTDAQKARMAERIAAEASRSLARRTPQAICPLKRLCVKASRTAKLHRGIPINARRASPRIPPLESRRAEPRKPRRRRKAQATRGKEIQMERDIGVVIEALTEMIREGGYAERIMSDHLRAWARLRDFAESHGKSQISEELVNAWRDHEGLADAQLSCDRSRPLRSARMLLAFASANSTNIRKDRNTYEAPEALKPALAQYRESLILRSRPPCGSFPLHRTRSSQ